MIKKNRNWLNLYLKNCKFSNKSKLTIENYRIDLEKFILWFEQNFRKDLSKVRSQHISQYTQYLADGGKIHIYLKQNWFTEKILKREKILLKTYIQNPLTSNSRRRHLSSIKNFFEFLKQSFEEANKNFSKNPVKPIIHQIRVKEVDIKHTENINPKQFEVLDETIYRPGDRLMLYLLYYGGLRLNELKNIKFESFDYYNESVKLKRKGGYIHNLKINNFLIIRKWIITYKEWLLKNNFRFNENGYLFISKDGGVLSNKTLYNRINKLIHKAGLKGNITPHSFRKACATNLYDDTKDLLLVRNYLNHKDASVTQTYIDR